MSRHGFGRRRTVLQLEEEPNKRESYGFGYRPAPDRSREVDPIGGLDLMRQYVEGSEEELEEEPSESRKKGRPVQFVASSERLQPSIVSREPATSSQVTMVTNGRSVSPDTTKPKDEIDSKVLDFLAELDAIEGPDTTSGDGDEGAGIDGEPLPQSPPHLQGDERTDSDSSDDGSPKAPAEPKTDWQQCLDDGTQCYYYWNFSTNEVTWDIPAEYSQYLLLYKEYEKQLEKYEKDLAEQPGDRRRKPKKKKKKKDKKQERTKPEAPTVYGPELPQSSTQPDPVAGPSLPPPLPPTLAVPLPPMEPPPQPPELPQPSQPSHMIPSSFPIGPQLPPPPPPPEEEPTVRQPVIGPELPSSSSGEFPVANGSQDDNSSLGEDMDVDEYIHRKLEEPVYSHYEHVNKKYDGPQPSDSVDDRVDAKKKSVVSSVVSYEDDDDDEDDIDIDDIDRELEKALERKQVELQSKEVDSNSKRKAPVEEPVTEKSSKRIKLNGQSTSGEQRASASKLKDDVKRKVESLAEVIETSELVSDKLEFLEVSRSGLSKLQVLLIEVQTRIEDWKAGGLNTDHFLAKLREAARQLEQYEHGAAPPNWSCNWDRKFKRYFYCNEITDETQWDYPTDLDGEVTSRPPPPKSKEPSQQVVEPREAPAADSVGVLDVNFHTQGPSLPGDRIHGSSRLAHPGFPELPEEDPVPVAYSYGTTLEQLFTAPPPPPPPPGEPSAPPEPEPQPPHVEMIGPQLPPPAPQLPLPDNHHHTLPDNHETLEAELDGVAMETFTVDEVRPKINMEHEVIQESHRDKMAIHGKSTHGKPAHISASPMMMHQALAPAVVEETPSPMSSDPVSTSTVETLQNEPGPSGMESTQSLSPAPVVLPTAEGSSSTGGTAAPSAAPTPPAKEKKKKKDKEKKDKSLVGRGISMKKKNVTGLVQKWQKVQKEVESEMAKQHEEAVRLEQELEAISNS